MANNLTTIASEIQRIKTNIANAYTALSDAGATLPATQNSDNLVICVESVTPQVEDVCYGLKTVYYKNSPVTYADYPSGTRDNLVISGQYRNQYFQNMSGFLTDFAFPDTITQLKIEMRVKFNSFNLNTTDYKNNILFGGGTNVVTNRFTSPSAYFRTINENSGYCTVYFSSNGTSWTNQYSTQTADNTVTKDTWFYFSYESYIDENGKVVIVAKIDDTIIVNDTTTATAILKPTNDLISFFYMNSSQDNYYIGSDITADMTKFKITVNNTVMSDGSKA